MEDEHRTNVHAVWISQRAQKWFQMQTREVQIAISDLLGADELKDLLHVPVQLEIKRINNRLVIA